MIGLQENCPATGETCVFVAEAQKLFTGNRDRVDHGTGSHDYDLFTVVMAEHTDLLDKEGEAVGPTPEGRCPLHEPQAKRAVGHLLNNVQSRPHSI